MWKLSKSRTKCSLWRSNMSRLESLASLVPSQCLWGKLQNPSLFKVSKQAVMSFCVAGVALRDIPTCFMTCQKSFCLAGAILCHVFRRCVAFFVEGTALETSDVILRGRRSTFDVSCCVFLQIALPALHEVVARTPPHSTLYTPHFTLYNLNSILHTPHLHSTLTLYTSHFTLHTLHFTLYTPHFTLYTLHSTLYTLYTPHFTLYTPHFTLHTLHFTLYTFRSTLQTLHSTLYTLHSTLYTSHPTLYTPPFTLYTLHFYTPYVTFFAPRSTF